MDNTTIKTGLTCFMCGTTLEYRSHGRFKDNNRMEIEELNNIIYVVPCPTCIKSIQKDMEKFKETAKLICDKTNKK
jgi:hypothetical protein